MTKKEIRNTINKAVYMYAESLGYQMSDDNDGSYVTFSKPNEISADNTIDYSRSYHECCVLSTANSETKTDSKRIDEFAQAVKSDIEQKQAIIEGDVK